jgi:hypothetical protein
MNATLGERVASQRMFRWNLEDLQFLVKSGADCWLQFACLLAFYPVTHVAVPHSLAVHRRTKLVAVQPNPLRDVVAASNPTARMILDSLAVAQKLQ